MRISSSSLPQITVHFSDGTRLVRCSGPPPEPRRAVCARLKTCNQLGIYLPYGVLRGIKMPLVRPPAVGERARDAQGLQQRLKLHEDVILPSAEDIGQDLARVVINRVPQPARMGFALHVAPPL